MVPTYIMMLRFGWIDTFWPLIIPGAANAFGIFFMRQYISAVSDELLDAARIDGASEFGIFWRIIVPIASPGIISLGLIFFMGSWNNYPGAADLPEKPQQVHAALVHDANVRPARLFGLSRVDGGRVISIVPLLIIFLVLQRRFVEGITAGAVKG